MTLRLSDLSPIQRRMLDRLDDGFDHEDSVGLEIEDMVGRDHLTLGSLIDKGLVEMVPGRRMQFWFRLTQAGRRVRETGVA